MDMSVKGRVKARSEMEAAEVALLEHAGLVIEPSKAKDKPPEPDEAFFMLEAVLDSFDTTGCEDCGVVDQSVMDAVENLLERRRKAIK